MSPLRRPRFLMLRLPRRECRRISLGHLVYIIPAAALTDSALAGVAKAASEIAAIVLAAAAVAAIALAATALAAVALAATAIADIAVAAIVPAAIVLARIRSVRSSTTREDKRRTHAFENMSSRI